METKDIQAIEAIQRTLTYKITEEQHLNYWERLHELLKLYSLQRRRERYIVIYIWKITQHIVSNIDGNNGAHNKNQKTSKTWNTVCYSVSNKQKTSTIPSRECNQCIWPRLYNSLPKYLSDIESVKTEKFKFELDKFLETIPDQQKMPNYVTASGSNNILDQLTHLRAQGIYHIAGGVLDSAMEQS